ncbi:MAG: L,D-transpeptidase family protein [Methylohalobius sp.]|nr:L,D-transpeptidase family protein [Methylohalobius sp.]
MVRKSISILVTWLITAIAVADSYSLPPGADLIGQLQTIKANRKDTFLEIARHFNLGQNEIRLANPNLNPWLLQDGAEVLLPKLFVLPDAVRQGIVLNIPEMRLYYFPAVRSGESFKVITHPVSIGRMDWATPLGTTRVVAKVKDPVWIPPESIKREHAADGDILPDVVPPGPDNPLGKYALRLGIAGYLIHGTDEAKEFGIGMRVTHGCVRMYPEDIERLFPQIPVGTPVTFVNQPIKLGWLNDELYIEVHPPLEERGHTYSYEDMLTQALALIERKTQGMRLRIQGSALRKALEEQTGVPVKIADRALPRT